MNKISEEKMFRAITGVDPALVEEAESPMQKAKKGEMIWLKRLGAAVGGLAAAFAILVGASCVSPALAASIPGMQSVVAMLVGDDSTPDTIVREGAVDRFVKPVPGASQTPSGGETEYPAGMEFTETYFDGSAIVLGLRITLEDAPEEYRQLVFEPAITFTAEGKDYNPECVVSDNTWAVLRRAQGSTYTGAVSVYAPKDVLDLPDRFTMTLDAKNLRAQNNKLMVLASEDNPYEYTMKEYTLEAVDPVSCEVSKNLELRKVYEVDETKEGCTLENIVVTPAWTEINISADKAQASEGVPIVMIPYGSDGSALEGIYLYGEGFENQRFRPLSREETQITVKFFRKDNKFDPVAEFTIPVTGGYADPNFALKSSEAEEDVVYDPPMPENSYQSGNRAVSLTLGETLDNANFFLNGGKARVSMDNIRYYDSWEDAGIPTEEMNLPFSLENGDTVLDSYTFVLFDLTVERYEDPADASSEMHLMGPADFFYAPPGMTLENFGSTMVCSEEIAYLEGHGRGFSDYYHFSVEPNTTQTVQVGVLAETEKLQAGQAVISLITDDVENAKVYDDGHVYTSFLYHLYTIPPKDDK